ncbi:putative signal peptide protein [Puccinia sorghi]|uniref:Putative signal peptide protein n=1 Tax=Puccinia sorghi TaxID=27349 RepID=A0A0L6U6C5_9BASI|nr:putative signal peptide protein [Puccinia sorghi]
MLMLVLILYSNLVTSSLQKQLAQLPAVEMQKFPGSFSLIQSHCPYFTMIVPKYLNMQACGVWMTAWLEHAACQLKAVEQVFFCSACSSFFPSWSHLVIFVLLSSSLSSPHKSSARKFIGLEVLPDPDLEAMISNPHLFSDPPHLSYQLLMEYFTFTKRKKFWSIQFFSHNFNMGEKNLSSSNLFQFDPQRINEKIIHILRRGSHVETTNTTTCLILHWIFSTMPKKLEAPLINSKQNDQSISKQFFKVEKPNNWLQDRMFQHTNLTCNRVSQSTPNQKAMRLAEPVEPNQKAMRLAELSSLIRMLQCHLLQHFLNDSIIY